jgi:hypothetical protein
VYKYSQIYILNTCFSLIFCFFNLTSFFVFFILKCQNLHFHYVFFSIFFGDHANRFLLLWLPNMSAYPDKVKTWNLRDNPILSKEVAYKTFRQIMMEFLVYLTPPLFLSNIMITIILLNSAICYLKYECTISFLIKFVSCSILRFL